MWGCFLLQSLLLNFDTIILDITSGLSTSGAKKRAVPSLGMGRSNGVGMIGTEYREWRWTILCCMSCALYDIQRHPWPLATRSISLSRDNRNVFGHCHMSSGRQGGQKCRWLRTTALRLSCFRGDALTGLIIGVNCMLDAGQWGWWQGI